MAEVFTSYHVWFVTVTTRKHKDLSLRRSKYQQTQFYVLLSFFFLSAFEMVLYFKPVSLFSQMPTCREETLFKSQNMFSEATVTFDL